jgi:superfamily I DNA/RNA helicase
LKDLIILIKRNNDYDHTQAFSEISKLLTIYDLRLAYPNRFDLILDWYCKNFKSNLKDFLSLMEKNKTNHEELKKLVSALTKNLNIKNLRNNKKLHFYMNSGTVKLSTIHSFKGWESETVFLIIEKKFPDLEVTFDEIIYTGLTRSKKNLIIINFGNVEYNDKLKELVKTVNS